MTLHAALILLGAFCAVALVGVGAAMLMLHWRIHNSETRERAIPTRMRVRHAGPGPWDMAVPPGSRALSPALWDGKNALDRAEDASRIVLAQADGDSDAVRS